MYGSKYHCSTTSCYIHRAAPFIDNSGLRSRVKVIVHFHSVHTDSSLCKHCNQFQWRLLVKDKTGKPKDNLALVYTYASDAKCNQEVCAYIVQCIDICSFTRHNILVN